MSLILLFHGFSPEQLPTLATNPSPYMALALGWGNVGHQLGAFALPALFYFWIHKKPRFELLTLKCNWQFWLIGTFSMIVGAGCIDLLGEINLQILQLSPSISQWAHLGEESQIRLQQALILQPSVIGLVQVIFIMAIVPAIFEEFFFRGALFDWLLQWWSPKWVVMTTGFIFSLIHFQFEGFLPRWFMGVFLGMLVYKSGSLWPSILAHFINNFCGILLFFHFDGQLNTPNDHWMSSPTWWISSSIFMTGLILWLWKFPSKKHYSYKTDHGIVTQQ